MRKSHRPKFCYTDLEMARSTPKVPCDSGGIELIPQYAIEASQHWFWSDRWQRMEREADDDVAANRITRFNSADEFIAELDSR